MNDNKKSSSHSLPVRSALLRELDEAASSVAEKIVLDNPALTEKLKAMYKKCFMDTAERTLLLPGESSSDAKGNTHTVSEEVFIITGDINAMWLRDSSAQVCHYLPFAGKYPEITKLIASLIRRQQICILRDPYANAYLEWTEAVSEWENDRCGMVAGDWERKYETDSLSYHILLVKKYIDATGDQKVLDAREAEVIENIISLWERECDHENASSYSFERTRKNGKYAGLARDGKGTPTSHTGMTWSGFRPSDDACKYGFNIPENLFAATVLKYVEDFASLPGINEKFADLKSRAEALRSSIETGVAKYGTVMHPEFGTIYAYEVDGTGEYLLMDDPNVPSLMALPYLGACPDDDEIYINTRRYVLSPENPWYFKGSAAKGVGSPHTPYNYIWPIGLIMEGMTGASDKTRMSLLKTLINTDAGTLSMHESFNVDNPAEFTRSWFAWADSLFAEFVAEIFS